MNASLYVTLAIKAVQPLLVLHTTQKHTISTECSTAYASVKTAHLYQYPLCVVAESTRRQEVLELRARDMLCNISSVL